MGSLRAGSVGRADRVGHHDTGNSQLSVRARFFRSKDRVNCLHEHPSEPQNGNLKLFYIDYTTRDVNVLKKSGIVKDEWLAPQPQIP